MSRCSWTFPLILFWNNKENKSSLISHWFLCNNCVISVRWQTGPLSRSGRVKCSGFYLTVRQNPGAVSQRVPACFQHLCRRCACSDKQVGRNAVKSLLWVIFIYTCLFSFSFGLLSRSRPLLRPSLHDLRRNPKVHQQRQTRGLMTDDDDFYSCLLEFVDWTHDEHEITLLLLYRLWTTQPDWSDIRSSLPEVSHPDAWMWEDFNPSTLSGRAYLKELHTSWEWLITFFLLFLKTQI